MLATTWRTLVRVRVRVRARVRVRVRVRVGHVVLEGQAARELGGHGVEDLAERDGDDRRLP